MHSKPASVGTPIERLPASKATAFHAVLAQLRENPDSLPWPARCELGRAVGETLAAGGVDEDVLALTHQLAADRKWEVRRVIADLLPVVPDEDFHRLAARLVSDSNTYVRRSVERALAHRQRIERAARRKRRSADQMSQHFSAIETEYGKAAATKARRVCQRYGELLVGSMVHDLRSILAHLKANCFALLSQSAADKRDRGEARVRRDFEFLELTIADMELFTGPLEIERRPERLIEVVRQAFEVTWGNLRRAGIEPTPVFAVIDVPQRIEVCMARHLIAMALVNVIKNAYESFLLEDGTLRHGSITLEARASGEEVCIEVQDDGIGIAEHEAIDELLLMPGRRNKRKQFSTGYGLSIAARNLAAHEGTLTIQSRDNVGTKVTLMLPLRPRREGGAV